MQSGPPGSQVAAGSSVDLIVAIPMRIVVPDLMGRAVSDARDILSNAGLRVGSVTADRTGTSDGRIQSQSPAAGTAVDAETPVTLVISPSGPQRGTGGQDKDKQAPPRARPSPTPRAPQDGPAPRRPTSGFDETDAALAQLLAGTVAFSTPDRMRLSESRVLGLLISPTLTAEQLAIDLRNRLRGSDEIRSESLQLAPQMEAHIRGDAFEIEQLTPVRQAVGKGTPTEWRWNITARKSGTHPLHLAISAVLIVEGDRVPRLINVLDRAIEVEITPWQRIQQFSASNWQFIIGTVLIPFGVWLWTRRKTEATHRKGHRRPRPRDRD